MTITEPQVLNPIPPLRPRHRPLVWLTLALVILVGFAGLFAIAQEWRVILPPHSGWHSPALAPVTTPTTQAPPALATTGANPDWDAVVRTILAYDYWLRVHPDPVRVADVYDPSGGAYAETVAGITSLATGERRYEVGPSPFPVAVVRLEARDDRSASVFVRYGTLPPQRVVDRDGNVIPGGDLPERDVRPSFWRLLLGEDGRWRLAETKPA